MKVPFVDLSTQYRAIKPEIDAAVQAVLDRGDFVSGPFVAAFEKNFAQMHRAAYCVGVSSGTSALHLAMWALGIRAGDEVIVPTNTFIASASTVSLAGAVPVFVDCDKDYYNIDPDNIEKAITAKTRALVAVHLYGQPAPMDRLKTIADKHGILLIEDCAQAHLAEYQGRPIGTFGACGCFSFYPSKNLGAYGEAGAVLTNDEGLYQKMMMLREHGSKEKYHYQYVGQNYRMHGMQGAILDVKLKHLPQWTEERRKKAALYRRHLKGIDAVKLPEELPEAKHVYHLFVVRTSQREALAEALKKREIGVGIHYPIPCHLQECYAMFGKPKTYLPIAEHYANEIISLPMFPELTEGQIRFTCDKIREFFHA